MQQALSPYLGMAAAPSTLANMQQSIYNVLTTPTPQLDKFNPITGYFEAKNKTLINTGVWWVSSVFQGRLTADTRSNQGKPDNVFGRDCDLCDGAEDLVGSYLR